MKIDFDLPLKKTDKVLDVGCWRGNRVGRLMRYCDIYGLDINLEHMDEAPKRVRSRLLHGNIRDKELEFSRKFDYVLLIDIIEHFKGYLEAINTTNRILEDGGKVLIKTPRYIPFFNYWDPAWVNWKLFNKEMHYHFKLEELKEALELGGFKIEEVDIQSPLGWVLKRWYNVFLKYILSSSKQVGLEHESGYFNWVILARKIK